MFLVSGQLHQPEKFQLSQMPHQDRRRGVHLPLQLNHHALLLPQHLENVFLDLKTRPVARLGTNQVEQLHQGQYLLQDHFQSWEWEGHPRHFTVYGINGGGAGVH